MIQAPGMHGRAAAVHCTCSAEKTRLMRACVLREAFFSYIKPSPRLAPSAQFSRRFRLPHLFSLVIPRRATADRIKSASSVLKFNEAEKSSLGMGRVHFCGP